MSAAKKAPPKAKTAKLPYHRHNLRRSLLEASLAIIHEEGIAFLSLREVARRAKVSHAAPYHYFESKKDILASIAEEGFTALSKAMAKAISKDTDPIGRFSKLGNAYIRYAITHPSHFKVMFGVILSDRSKYPNLDKAASDAFGYLLSIVKEAGAASLLADYPEEDMAVTAWSLVHGLSNLWMEGTLKAVGLKTGIDRLASRLGEICLLGMVKRQNPGT